MTVPPADTQEALDAKGIDAAQVAYLEVAGRVSHGQGMEAAIRAYLSATTRAPGEGEPVAWRWRGPNGGWIYDEAKPKWHCEPVYATPPALAAPSYAQPAPRADLVEALPNVLMGQIYRDENNDRILIGFEHSAQKEIARLNGELLCMSEAIAALSEAPREAERQHDRNGVYFGHPYPATDQLKRGLDNLRARASRGGITTAEVFSMTDQLMDWLARLPAAPKREG